MKNLWKDLQAFADRAEQCDFALADDMRVYSQQFQATLATPVEATDEQWECPDILDMTDEHLGVSDIPVITKEQIAFICDAIRFYGMALVSKQHALLLVDAQEAAGGSVKLEVMEDKLAKAIAALSQQDAGS